MFRPYHWRLQPAWWYRIWRWRGRLGVTQPSTHMPSTFLGITHSPRSPGPAFQAEGAGAFLCTSGRPAPSSPRTHPCRQSPPCACTHAGIPRTALTPLTTLPTSPALRMRPHRSRFARSIGAPNQPRPAHARSISVPNQPRRARVPPKPTPHFQQTSHHQTFHARMLVSCQLFGMSAHGPVRRGCKRRESLRGERKQPNQDGAEQPASPPFDSVRSMPYHTRRV